MTFKIVSLNLWNGGRLLEAALEFLAGQAADVVCLQEVYNGTEPRLEPRFRTVEILKQRLPYESCVFAPAMIDRLPDGTEVVSGAAVLTRFPAQAGEVVFFNEPFQARDADDPATFATMPRTLQHVSLDTPAGAVNVFNIHGVWDLDGDNFSERRRRMRDAILRAIKDQPNVILAGDTNARPTNPAIEAVAAELKSVFGPELTTTFNMKHKDNPGYAASPVDMIFVSPTINVLEHTCHQADVSDHLPLSATLEIA